MKRGTERSGAENGRDEERDFTRSRAYTVLITAMRRDASRKRQMLALLGCLFASLTQRRIKEHGERCNDMILHTSKTLMIIYGEPSSLWR